MSKTFRRYEPDQMLLMPVALQEWLPADHLAYFISDVVDQVDLKEILSRYVRWTPKFGQVAKRESRS